MRRLRHRRRRPASVPRRAAAKLLDFTLFMAVSAWPMRRAWRSALREPGDEQIRLDPTATAARGG